MTTLRFNKTLSSCFGGLLMILAGTTTASSQVIDPTLYSGADLCHQIQAAIAANATTFPDGLIIDARSASGTQHCSVNPFTFTGSPVKGQLLLGMVILKTTVPIVTPSQYGWQIIGTGRGDHGQPAGTLIFADSGFPTGGNVLRLGDGTDLAFANRAENLAIDCNGVSGTTGLYSSDIQEESGGSNLLIANCPNRGLWINGSGTGGGVSPYADNYDFHDVESLFATSVACEFDGEQQHQNNGPHIVDGLTCAGASGANVGTAFIFDGISASHISNLNAENATSGYVIGNVAPLRAVTIDTMRGAGVTGTLVHINNSSAPVTGNLLQAVTLNNIINSDNGSAITLQDDVQGNTLHDFTIASYWIGEALPRAGGGYSHWSSSPSVSGIVPPFTTDNGTNAFNVLDIGSGNTSTEASLVEFVDRGSPKWNLGKETFNNFQLFDVAGGIERIYAQAVM